jgi:hypothetical protein
MINMKNLIKILFVMVGLTVIFTACHKEGALPFYKEGNAVVLTSSTAAVTAAIADSSKSALALNWTWPNYATDSAHQKFVIEIDSTGKNFAKPYARVLTGKLTTSFTAKDLNLIVFGFGAVKSSVYSLDVRVISSYANNNELYKSNTVTVKVTPYLIPVTLATTPAGPLTMVMANGANTAVTATWNATQYGNKGLNYSIQIQKSGGTWTTPAVKDMATALTGKYTVTELNRLAIAAGIAANTTGTLNFRIIAYQGTSYANPVYSNVTSLTVTTYLDVVKFWVVGGYNGWDNSDNALFIMNTPTTGANAEGYVNFTAAGEFKLTTDHSWADNQTFGDDGTNTGKLKNPGGNIAVASAGFYLIKANPLTMTYSLTKTTWGVIGTSTPGGWGSQTDMTYNPTLKIFQMGLTMPLGEFKFRGTSDWAINYGNTAADGKTLNQDGANIPITLVADYAITLDLSHPNAYTFSANRWGVVGAATGDATWSIDKNMTWDAVNKVFTVTAAMVPGEYKFRANGAWDINLGGSLTALTLNGGNLAIAVAGNYKITLNPWALTATATKL